MHKKVFIANVFKMSFAMLGVNLSNICYSIYISAKAGAHAIGLYHLIMSIYSMATVVAVSGIGLTVTRLVADSGGKDYYSTVIKCLKVSLCTALFASIAIFLFSEKIASSVISEPSCAKSFRILSPSLICLSVSAVMGGFFTATGKVSSLVTGRFVSEIVVWILTFVFLYARKSSDPCTGIISAFSLGMAAECVSDIIMWKRASCSKSLSCNKVTYRSVISLSAPIAAGSYLRTGLSGLENILIPEKLRISGIENALAQYGIIKGMALPLMMFPALFTNAFSNFIVPEIAKRRSNGQKNSVRYISGLSVEYALKFAVMISSVFFMYHSQLANSFYSEKKAGIYLGFLSFLPVLMFADTVIDSVLKGLDKQVSSLKINIADSFMRVILIIVLVPVYGIEAYIALLYLSELFNITLSCIILKKSSHLSFPFITGIIHPAISAIISVQLVSLMNFTNYASGIFMFCGVYVIIICVLKNFKRRKA